MTSPAPAASPSPSTAVYADAERRLEEALFAQLAESRKSTKDKPLPELAKAKKLELKEGEELFSAVFGKVPKNGDFAVRKFDASHPAVSAHVPRIDTDYVPQIEEAARLVRGIMDNDKVLITGPTGSGKSSLVKYVCAVLNLPFIRINMSGDMESAAFFGQLTIRGGTTHWEDGPMTEAMRHGALVLCDEWELMPPEISMGLQNILEEDGFLYLKEMPGSSADKTIRPHANFRLVCAGNTVGQGDDSGGFAGTMVQNSATIDRFTTTVVLGYLGTDHEVAVVTGKSGISADMARKMVQLAGLVRNAHEQRQINLTMSPRTLINWARKSERYGDIGQGFVVAFFDKLRESDRRVVSELFKKVFGRGMES